MSAPAGGLALCQAARTRSVYARGAEPLQEPDMSNQPSQGISQGTVEARAVRACQMAPVFARMADGVVHGVRRALGVPDHAEPEVEQELRALRSSFDEQYRPEFERLFGALLVQQLGHATSVVLGALESEPVQQYLAVAEQIDADILALLRELSGGIGAALSPPSPLNETQPEPSA